MSTVSAEAVAQAVNAANTVRRDNGAPVIQGLDPNALQKEPTGCVLAKAFNFDFKVNGWSTAAHDDLAGVWYAATDLGSADQAQALADALGTGVILTAQAFRGVDEFGRYDTDELFPVLVILPEAVAQIAQAFDAGTLDPKHFEPTHDAEGNPLR